MAGAVSDRVDVIGRRRAPLVHYDAVVAADAGRRGELLIGDDADPDHDDIGRNGLVAAVDGFDRAFALERGNRRRQPDVDPSGAVGVRVVLGHFGERSPGRESGPRLR